MEEQTMAFLKNAWYVAAWDDEVSPAALFHRRVLGERILLVRDEKNVVHALRDRCPHRFAPLHLGVHCGNAVQCGYHGLTFNFEGRCIATPQGDEKIPTRAVVPTYPLVAQHMLLWIWMGDPARADPASIPQFSGLDPKQFAINKGYLHTPVNYEYITDNIMDLGHIEFLHKGLLGSEAVRHARTEMRQEGTTVHSNRLTHAEILPPPLDDLYGGGGRPVDRWLDVRWDAPALMQLVVGIAPTGSPARVGRETPGVHLMTPETEASTHYFWSVSRDFRLDDADLHAQLDSGLRFAFEHQDKPMLIAQRDAIEDAEFWSLNPIVLEGDAGAVRARRILRRLIREEQAAAKATTPATA
jgi:phenylpropionate dioxygenase-like ring-hydroxylating dioxygenase large terminal subunit